MATEESSSLTAEELDQRAAKSSFERGLEKLREQITCIVCQQPYQDPRVLPCLHYFCRECIQTLIQGEICVTDSDPNYIHDYVRCPKCRRIYAIANCVPSRLAQAHFVSESLETYWTMKKAQGASMVNSEIHCEMCEGGKAVEFCRQCEQFACNYCVGAHKKMKQFMGHQVIGIRELTDPRRSTKKRAKLVPKCSRHKEEDLKLYCYTCTRLICRDCILIEHKDHNCKFVDEVAGDHREKLTAKLAPVVRIQGHISDGANAIEAVQREVRTQGEAVVATICADFDPLIQTLERRKQELIEEATTKTDEKIEDLDGQLKGFTMIASELQEVRDFVDRNVKDSGNAQLMALEKDMTNRVDEIIQKYEHHDLQPVAVANLKVKPPVSRDVENACRGAMILETQANPSRSTVEGAGIRVAETNHKASFTVRAMDSKGNAVKKQQDVTATLKSLADKSAIPADVQNTDAGVYEVSYTPRIRGRHQLRVFVNNETISGSPFSVLVRHHPRLLGKPTHTIDGLSDPHAVAVTQEFIAITEWPPGKVTFFDIGDRHPFKNLQKIGGYPLKKPTGLAVDSEGSLFLADTEDNSIVKFSVTGDLIARVGEAGMRHGEFKMPGGIAVHQERLYVCDRSNHRVQIFNTRDLAFVGSFGHKKGELQGQFNFPSGVAVDSTGEVYVADTGNHRVQVFNRDGEYLRHFGKVGSEAGSFNRPCFVEIDSEGFVYVTEEQNHRVSVFDRNGVYVTHFGNDQTKMDMPKGVCADSDGFIYICDHGNNTLQVF